MQPPVHKVKLEALGTLLTAMVFPINEPLLAMLPSLGAAAVLTKGAELEPGQLGFAVPAVSPGSQFGMNQGFTETWIGGS